MAPLSYVSPESSPYFALPFFGSLQKFVDKKRKLSTFYISSYWFSSMFLCLIRSTIIMYINIFFRCPSRGICVAFFYFHDVRIASFNTFLARMLLLSLCFILLRCFLLLLLPFWCSRTWNMLCILSDWRNGEDRWNSDWECLGWAHEL